MLDNETGGLGHNLPPAFDATVVAELKEKADEFLSATKVWQDLEKIETEVQAGQLTDQVDGLRGLYKKVDDARKVEKKPHDAAAKAVQDAFNPILKKLKLAADVLKPKLADYATAKAEAEEKARREAEAEAKRKADEAAELAKAAEESGDIGAQVDAEEAQKKAVEAEKLAKAKVTTNVKSATGAGRTMSLRTQKEVEITNVRVLFMHYQDRPEVAEVLLRLASADVRSKDYDPENAPIPGVIVTERKVMA